MVAHTVRVLMFVLLPLLVWGQSLNLSVSAPTSNNNPSTFLLDNGKVDISSNTIRFFESGTTINYDAVGISPDYSIVSILQRTGDRGKITVLNSKGSKLNAFSTVMLSDDDPSLSVYPANNGDVLLRDNISNFTFYKRGGNIATNMSSSSQSEQGEKISQVAMSDNRKTVVVYSPKIKRDSNFGSKAQLKMSDGSFKEIFFSSDRFLKEVNVSDDGNMIAAITAKSGTNDQALIMDKYGNELNTISTDEDLVNVTFSSDNEYVTLYSTGRVMVHSVLDGNSLGATSFGSSIFLADFFPEDNLILALTGSYSATSGVLSNVEFRAVNLKKRSITSEELSGSLGFSDAIKANFNRTSSNEYQLMGGSKRVQIQANF